MLMFLDATVFGIKGEVLLQNCMTVVVLGSEFGSVWQS